MKKDYEVIERMNSFLNAIKDDLGYDLGIENIKHRGNRYIDFIGKDGEINHISYCKGDDSINLNDEHFGFIEICKAIMELI